MAHNGWHSVEAVEYELIYSNRLNEHFIKATVRYNEIHFDEIWWSPDKPKARGFWDKYVKQIVGKDEFKSQGYDSYHPEEFEDEWHSWPVPNRVKIRKTTRPGDTRTFVNIMDVEHYESEDDELLKEIY